MESLIEFKLGYGETIQLPELTNDLGEFILMGDPIPIADQFSIIINPIQFGTHRLTGLVEILSGFTSPWIILDSTRIDQGWHVNINATDFSDEFGHTIPINNLQVRLPQANISTIVGMTTPFSDILEFTDLSPFDQVLVHASFGQGTGRFNITPEFQLVVPANAFIGSYSNQVTVTIIAGPN